MRYRQIVALATLALVLAAPAAAKNGDTRLAVASDADAFGSVAVGSSATANVTVTNTTHGRSAELAVTLSGDEFTVAADGCTGVRLSGGATCTVVVVFAPATAGPATATLTVDGGHDGVATASFDGTGAYPLAMSIRPNDGFDRNGVPHLVPGVWWVDDPTNAYSPQEWRPDPSQLTVTSPGPVGQVTLSSSCPLTYSQTGADTFGVTLGDSAHFGATFGVTPASRETAGVVCALTASAPYAVSESMNIRVAGEYCDGVDNNGNGLADENYVPLRGSLSVQLPAGLEWGRWDCWLGGTKLAANLGSFLITPYGG